LCALRDPNEPMARSAYPRVRAVKTQNERPSAAVWVAALYMPLQQY
jgi:hypothetical protein